MPQALPESSTVLAPATAPGRAGTFVLRRSGPRPRRAAQGLGGRDLGGLGPGATLNRPVDRPRAGAQARPLAGKPRPVNGLRPVPDRLTAAPASPSRRGDIPGGPMPDPDPEADARRLEALEARLREARPAPEPSHGESHYSQAQLAWRMVIELVAGLMIGFGLGYGIDWALGTMPIFLVIFIFLGLAAGIRTMLRSAREVQRKREGAGRRDGG